MPNDLGYIISGEKDPTRDYLGAGRALACLKIVEGYLGPDCDPKLYRDHEGPFWNISYEGGPEEWAYRVTMDDTVTWPDGVHVECVATDWCIGLYPDGKSDSSDALVKRWDAAVAQGSEWAQQRIGADMARYLRDH